MPMAIHVVTVMGAKSRKTVLLKKKTTPLPLLLALKAILPIPAAKIVRHRLKTWAALTWKVATHLRISHSCPEMRIFVQSQGMQKK